MRLVIAGYRGYIGSHLTNLLLTSNIDVYGISRERNSYLFSNLATRNEIVKGSFDQIASYLQSRNEVFDVFVNLAAETTKASGFEDIKKLGESNLIFNALFAKLAIELRVTKYCFTSTYSVSMDGKTYNPQTFYAATKYASEKLLDYFSNSHGLKVIKLHLYDIYGPRHDKGKILSLLINALMNNENLELSRGTQEFSPLYILDACKAICTAIKIEFQEPFKEYSVMGPEIFTVRELAYSVSKAFGRPWGEDQLTFSPNFRFNEIMKVVPIYKKLTDWSPEFDLKAGIAEIRKEIELNT